MLPIYNVTWTTLTNIICVDHSTGTYNVTSARARHNHQWLAKEVWLLSEYDRSLQNKLPNLKTLRRQSHLPTITSKSSSTESLSCFLSTTLHQAKNVVRKGVVKRQRFSTAINRRNGYLEISISKMQCSCSSCRCHCGSSLRIDG